MVGIHHLEGHLLSPLLCEPAPGFPFVALLVSGGHTQLMRVQGVGRYELLGETQDDAAGEAFDKTASLLGLGYPGGPALARLAETGDAKRFDFPRPMIAKGNAWSSTPSQSRSTSASWFPWWDPAVAENPLSCDSSPDSMFRIPEN